MAHLVEQMFSVRETPWHGLGRIIQEAPSTKEAIVAAGLDWTVSQRDLQHFDPATGLWRKVDGYKMIVRDKDEQQFAVLSDDFTPLQNTKAFEFFDPFILGGDARFETAGSLRGGRNVWVLSTLNKDPIKIGRNDLVKKFLLLSNGHDGSMAVRIGFTPIRVVCANTMAMAHDSGQSNLLRIFHTKQIATNLEKVRELINTADASFEATAEQYRYLASKKISRADLKKFVDVTFNFSDKEEELHKQERRLKVMTAIFRLVEEGRGSELETAKGTMWGAYNAVSEFLSYEVPSRSQDSRLHKLWFGDSANVNAKALKVATELAVAA